MSFPVSFSTHRRQHADAKFVLSDAQLDNQIRSISADEIKAMSRVLLNRAMNELKNGPFSESALPLIIARLTYEFSLPGSFRTNGCTISFVSPRSNSIADSLDRQGGTEFVKDLLSQHPGGYFLSLSLDQRRTDEQGELSFSVSRDGHSASYTLGEFQEAAAL